MFDQDFMIVASSQENSAFDPQDCFCHSPTQRNLIQLKPSWSDIIIGCHPPTTPQTFNALPDNLGPLNFSGYPNLTMTITFMK